MSAITLDQIPTTFEANEPSAQPSVLVGRIRKNAFSRRGVLRTAGVAGAVAALNLVSWISPTARRALAADTTHGWDSCAEQGNYTPPSNNYCYGTTAGLMDDVFCRLNQGYEHPKWHRSNRDQWLHNGTYRESWWKMDTCVGKNAWIWSGYRCSDGNTRYLGSSPYTKFTICQVKM
ncbi:hypothetical protein [Nonomuraea sp. SBT364]|uniref:hypothetical protein n=1 Tax=Nonomuraea sp. SBT364 TaxID=1580530 RepID=UPI00066E6ADB|nr:hypothetical protein [Nonomuraea sp. SBT364]